MPATVCAENNTPFILRQLRSIVRQRAAHLFPDIGWGLEPFSLLCGENDISLTGKETFLLADIKLQERNIDIPGVFLFRLFLLCGGIKNAVYARCMKNGAIEGFMRQNGIVPVKRTVIWGGAAVIAACKVL